RHPEGVAVAGDAGDHALDEMARLRVLGATEAQRVETRDRPRAHGEHIAQDAAYARRRALVGLDERRVVVRLHLEDHRLPVADVDDAGVFARTLNDARPRRRQAAQVDARGLVRAVLAPHDAEDAELGVGRRAPEDLVDATELVGRQAVLFGRRFVDWRFLF